MVGFLGLGLPSLAGVPPESQVPNTGADLKDVCRILEISARLEYGVAAAESYATETIDLLPDGSSLRSALSVVATTAKVVGPALETLSLYCDRDGLSGADLAQVSGSTVGSTLTGGLAVAPASGLVASAGIVGIASVAVTGTLVAGAAIAGGALLGSFSRAMYERRANFADWLYEKEPVGPFEGPEYHAGYVPGFGIVVSTSKSGLEIAKDKAAATVEIGVISFNKITTPLVGQFKANLRDYGADYAREKLAQDLANAMLSGANVINDNISPLSLSGNRLVERATEIAAKTVIANGEVYADGIVRRAAGYEGGGRPTQDSAADKAAERAGAERAGSGGGDSGKADGQLLDHPVDPKQNCGRGWAVLGKVDGAGVDPGRQRRGLEDAEERAQLVLDHQGVLFAAAARWP